MAFVNTFLKNIYEKLGPGYFTSIRAALVVSCGIHPHVALNARHLSLNARITVSQIKDTNFKCNERNRTSARHLNAYSTVWRLGLPGAATTLRYKLVAGVGFEPTISGL